MISLKSTDATDICLLHHFPCGGYSVPNNGLNPSVFQIHLACQLLRTSKVSKSWIHSWGVPKLPTILVNDHTNNMVHKISLTQPCEEIECPTCLARAICRRAKSTRSPGHVGSMAKASFKKCSWKLRDQNMTMCGGECYISIIRRY